VILPVITGIGVHHSSIFDILMLLSRLLFYLHHGTNLLDHNHPQEPELEAAGEAEGADEVGV
jgi:hypothetical protein